MCNISKYRNKTIPQPSESKFEDEEQSQSQNSFLDSESTSNKLIISFVALVMLVVLVHSLKNKETEEECVVLFNKGQDNMSISMSMYKYSERCHKWKNIKEITFKANEFAMKSKKLIDVIPTRDHILLYFGGTKKIRVDLLDFDKWKLTNQGYLISRINSTTDINMCEIDGKILIKKPSRTTNDIILETFSMNVTSQTNYKTIKNNDGLEIRDGIKTNCMVCLGNVVHFIGSGGALKQYRVSYDLKTKQQEEHFLFFSDDSIGYPEQIKATVFKGNLYLAVKHAFSDNGIYIYEYDEDADILNQWYHFETISTDEPVTQFFIEANDDHLFIFYGDGNVVRYSDELDAWIKLPKIHMELSDIALIRVFWKKF